MISQAVITPWSSLFSRKLTLRAVWHSLWVSITRDFFYPILLAFCHIFCYNWQRGRKESLLSFRPNEPIIHCIMYISMKLRPALFWDTNPKNIDLKKNAQYIIERVADFGNDKEARWVWDYYSKRLLHRVISRSLCISPLTKNFWLLWIKSK